MTPYALLRRIELGTERESLLQVLDKDAHFSGQPAAGRSDRKDWHSSFEGSQKTDHSTFSKFRGEQPRWRLGDAEMFEDTHPHLLNIAGTKDSCGDNTLGVLSGAKGPRLYRPPLDKNDGLKAAELFRRSWGAVP
jgi:hypothetical protein